MLCAAQTPDDGVDTNGTEDDGYEESDDDSALMEKPEKRAFGAVDLNEQREYEQWAHKRAKRLNKQRMWDAAIEVASDGLDIEPNSKFLDEDLTLAFLSKGNEELAAGKYGEAAIVFRRALDFTVDAPGGPVWLRDAVKKKGSKLQAGLAEANRGERNLRIPVYQDKQCAGCFCGFVGVTVLLATIGALSPAPVSICETKQPCHNGAECTDNLLDGTHTCTCAPGWIGEDCNTLGDGDSAASPPPPEPTEEQLPPLTDAETQVLLGIMLICGGAAVVWGGLWLRVVRKYPRKLVWITFGSVICAQCAFGASLLAGLGSPNGESNGFGILFFISAAFMALFGFILDRQGLVPFTASLFCAATDVMHEHSSMLAVVYGSTFTTLGWLFVCCLALAVTGVASYGSVLVYFTYFWFVHTAKAVVHCSVAGATANWYFVTHQIDPVAQATRRAVKTSLGSLAFGSLVTASLQIVRLVRAVVNSRKPLGGLNQTASGGRLAYILQTFNDYAYVQIAVYGTPYREAAKATAHLLANTEVVAIVGNTIVVSGVCMLGCILSGALGSALAWWLLLTNDMEELLGSDRSQAFSALCFCLGYLMALPHMEVLRAVTTTVLVCFAQNPHVLQANNPRLYNQIEGVFSDSVSPYDSDDQEQEYDEFEYDNASEYSAAANDGATRNKVRFQP